jgi:hypothetical protein
MPVSSVRVGAKLIGPLSSLGQMVFRCGFILATIWQASLASIKCVAFAIDLIESAITNGIDRSQP